MPARPFKSDADASAATRSRRLRDERKRWAAEVLDRHGGSLTLTEARAEAERAARELVGA